MNNLVTKSTKQVITYDWHCPDCGKPMSSSREPEQGSEHDMLCRSCISGEKRRSRFTSEFAATYEKFIGAKIVYLAPDNEYWYDLDHGSDKDIKAIEIKTESGDTYSISAKIDGNLSIRKVVATNER